MTAPAPLRCSGCNHRFGRRASLLLLFETFALCFRCATDPAIHRKLFVGCPRWHGSREHGGDIVSVGRARQALSSSTLTIN